MPLAIVDSLCYHCAVQIEQNAVNGSRLSDPIQQILQDGIKNVSRRRTTRMRVGVDCGNKLKSVRFRTCNVSASGCVRATKLANDFVSG